MGKVLLILFIIFLKILFSRQAAKRCDLSECNHEGECKKENNEKSCTCIGTNYFRGPKCSQKADNCQNENLCENGGKCKNVVGQFICEDCNIGFGGLWCNLKISNIFTKLLLYFNHLGFYGETHNFIIMMETLGKASFSLEFTSDKYAIDTFETDPEQANKWKYSGNLIKIIKSLGIRYYNDLPYSKGYYRVATETFWELGLLELTLISYDVDTATQLFYRNLFKLLIHSRKEECHPSLSFIHGTNPLNPLQLDMDKYNNFEVVLKKRCFHDSEILYHWSVYNSIGTVKLHSFGSTKHFILKVHPYKFWFNYHGEVVSSYRINVKMTEYRKGRTIETQARCFILVLPNPVAAIIAGGNYKEIGFKQNLILDATQSRDFALAPNVFQDMIFQWDCVSHDDSNNKYCKENISSSSILTIGANKLEVDKTYNFTVSINSKVNIYVYAQAYQLVKITENFHLNIDIKCLRNCKLDKFIHKDLLHLKVVTRDKIFSKAATFKWMLEDQVIENKENFIYSTKENDEILNIKVVVQDQMLTGEVHKTMEVNLSPANGFCSIKPLSGEAFSTNFHIKCQDYISASTPLNYEYLDENGFPLQRTNEAELHTKLPQTNAITIKICDPFQACVESRLEVKVKEVQKIEELKTMWKNRDGGLKNLIETGDVLKAMVLLKSLTKLPNTIEDTDAIVKEIDGLKIETLLQVQQFLQISQELVNTHLPLSAQKAYVLNKYFKKLLNGLRTTVNDNEIGEVKKLSYEKSCQDLYQIIHQFSQTWQTIPPVQVTMSSSNKYPESDNDIPDYDIKIVEDLKNWLDSAKVIHDSLAFISLGAKNLYAPWEDVFSIDNDNFHIEMFGFDKEIQQDITLQKINITLSQTCVKELQEIFNNPNILIQASTLKANPFWWFPTENPLNSDVFYMKAVGIESKKSIKHLKNPFQFQLDLKANNTSHKNVSAVLRNHLHMPLYTIDLPANAILLITFAHPVESLKFQVNINKRPNGVAVKNSGIEIKNTNEDQIFPFINPFNYQAQAYLAILLAKQLENINIKFYIEIRECLYWDFYHKDPQWSSQGCKPKLETPKDNKLTCFCHHFSIFTARSFQAPVQELVRVDELLTELPINWYTVGFYFILIIFIALILLYNFNQYTKRINFLPVNPSGTTDNDIEIRIFTGFHWNATCTSNISLQLISRKGSHSLTIYQNPDNPFLTQNSMCKLLTSSKKVDIPVKLIISNEQSSRYSSWYCHKIVIINWKTHQNQIFFIDQLICQTQLEVSTSDQNRFNFSKSFREHLSKVYINWYQFQSLWGCWLYDDLNRLERSCIEISSLIATVCLVACYFGPTTLETYEEERVMYYFLNFYIYELFLLSIVCYLLHFIIKFLFYSGLLLLHNICTCNAKKIA